MVVLGWSSVLLIQVSSIRSSLHPPFNSFAKVQRLGQPCCQYWSEITPRLDHNSQQQDNKGESATCDELDEVLHLRCRTMRTIRKLHYEGPAKWIAVTHFILFHYNDVEQLKNEVVHTGWHGMWNLFAHTLNQWGSLSRYYKSPVYLGRSPGHCHLSLHRNHQQTAICHYTTTVSTSVTTPQPSPHLSLHYNN